MYNFDKYFDFDSEKKLETKAKKRKKQNQQAILLLLLVAGAVYYYFMVYLPEEEIKQWETEIQEKLNEVKNAKADDYEKIDTLLNNCQEFLLWNTTGSETQKTALTNKKNELESAVKWLKENQLTAEKMEDENYRKGRIWDLPTKNWADKKLKNIPGNENKQGGLINLGSMDPQTKMVIGAIIFLVVYFTFIKEKEK